MASLRKLYRWCRRIWFPSVLEFAAHSPRRGRSNANRETDQPLSLSSTDKLDYIEESRTVFLTQIQKSRSNQISIKCTRISIEENRLLFRCSWNGSSWTMESFETCKIEEKDRMRWEKRCSINNSVINFPLWASEWKFAFVGRRADFIFRGCFDCHHLSPRLPPLFIFRDPSDCPTRRETSYLPFRSRKLFLPIAAFRPVFFFFFFPPRLIQLGQRNFYPPLSPSARFWTSVFNELRWLLQRFYRSLPVYLGPSG